MCLHTFCSNCITYWINTSSSNDCPICRNGIVVHVKNPVIDEVVKMLVDTTFTAKEKQERSKEIKELSSTFSPTPLRFHTSISENQQGETVLQEMHPDDSLLGRGTCAMMAQSLFREIWAKFQFDFNDDEDSIPEILLRRHLEMFISDWESLSLVYDSVSESALNASLCE